MRQAIIGRKGPTPHPVKKPSFYEGAYLSRSKGGGPSGSSSAARVRKPLLWPPAVTMDTTGYRSEDLCGPHATLSRQLQISGSITLQAVKACRTGNIPAIQDQVPYKRALRAWTSNP